MQSGVLELGRFCLPRCGVIGREDGDRAVGDAFEEGEMSDSAQQWRFILASVQWRWPPRSSPLPPRAPGVLGRRKGWLKALKTESRPSSMQSCVRREVVRRGLGGDGQAEFRPQAGQARPSAREVLRVVARRAPGTACMRRDVARMMNSSAMRRPGRWRPRRRGDAAGVHGRAAA